MKTLKSATELQNPEPQPTPPAPPKTCRERLAGVNDETKRLFARTLGLRDIVSGLERTLLFEIECSTAGGDDPLHTENQKAALTLWLHTDAASRLAVARATLTTLENALEFKAAAAEIEPLIAAVAALDAEELEHQAGVLRALQLRDAAEAAALAKAAQSAQSDPALVAARKELEKLQAVA